MGGKVLEQSLKLRGIQLCARSPRLVRRGLEKSCAETEKAARGWGVVKGLWFAIRVVRND